MKQTVLLLAVLMLLVAITKTTAGLDCTLGCPGISKKLVCSQSTNQEMNCLDQKDSITDQTPVTVNIHHKTGAANGFTTQTSTTPGFQMSPRQLLRKKRDGGELTKEEIEYFIKAMVAEEVSESQIGAFLMAMYIQGVSNTEAAHLTQSMVLSGDKMEWNSEWQGILVDKHSTGGVGDKISLILAPILAACGLKVPMVSGRSLEHTGGTLDKLESIPGFIVDLDQEMMKKALEHAGCFITAATSRLCPADKMLYRVRDITSTVDAINLITPSIISKKVASGTKFLVIDVKVGKAAFCKTIEMARALAKQLISVSALLGVRTRAVLSRMDEPLGNTAGNALEVTESIECLNGKMNPAISRLITVLGSNLLQMTDYKGDAEQCINQVVKDGSAMERFKRMMLLQGVNEETVRRLVQGEPVLPTAKYTTPIKAQMTGWVSNIDALMVGQVCMGLGAGRKTAADVIDPAVGVVIDKHVGDKVTQGEVLIIVHHSSSTLPQETVDYLQQAINIVDTEVTTPDVIIEVIE